MRLYFLQYNNYYNRLLKKEDTISAYQQKGVLVNTIYNTDFNPNDGVVAEKIVNIDLEELPDYLVVCNDADQIVSRWFIMDCVRTRIGQYKASLQRDLMADFQDVLYDAPVFLEKGYVNSNSSFIFNQESMSFNQIKQSETLLKDRTKIPWIVGYVTLPKDEETSADKTIPFRKSPVTASISVTTKTELPFYYTYTTPKTLITSASYLLRLNRDTPTKSGVYRIQFNEEGIITDDSQSLPYTDGLTVLQTNYQAVKDKINAGLNLNNVRIGLGQTIGGKIELEDYSKMKSYDKQIVYVGDEDKYYQVIFKEESVGNAPNIAFAGMTTVTPNSGLEYELKRVIQNQINNPTTLIEGTPYQNLSYPNSCSFGYKYEGKRAVLTLEEWQISDNETITIKSSRRQLEDAPYCMFCIPYGNYHIIDTDPDYPKNFVTSAEMGLSIGTGILALGSNWCYDVQILPYCPIDYLRDAPISINPDEGLMIDLSVLKKDIDYSVPTNLQATKQIVFWSRISNGTFNIDFTKNIPANTIDFKVETLTTMQRLSSPNFASQFEFNYCKNGGIQYFNVDYNYRPINPYIHINPNFGRLYGNDYNDPRGLICSGDFSITSVIDQWQQYELQNKNYQLIFNRQLENMEVNHAWERGGNIVGAITGTAQGVASGAMLGSMIKPGVGTAIGAAVGGVTSAIGGIADIGISEALYNEARDFTKDMFGMQLDNIKALPYTLSKVSTINQNNKLFPVLEFYDCTYEEKQALKNKLKYNGMTIGVVYDTFEQAPKAPERWYYKGKIIRAENFNDDYHILNALATEFDKGVFIDG